MSWHNFFTKILVINLKRRQDRLIDIYEEMGKMGIPFEVVTAIENENGAIGLRDTLVSILEQGVKEKWESVLIFEDDCVFTQNKDVVDDTINRAITQLPDNWQILYLSAQCTCGFTHRVGSNLLGLQGAFATHSWAISQQGMKDILGSNLQAPIDNHVVANTQKQGNTYITYPILTTQKAGTSDIGGTYIEWDAFITPRYYQKLAEMQQ
jgi:GR25 family glycosyltransferase involved in LPS biosynthesis